MIIKTLKLLPFILMSSVVFAGDIDEMPDDKYVMQCSKVFYNFENAIEMFRCENSEVVCYMERHEDVVVQRNMKCEFK